MTSSTGGPCIVVDTTDFSRVDEAALLDRVRSAISLLQRDASV